MAISPYMSIVLPDVSITPGPTWASELNAGTLVIDSHDHTPGKGVPIPSGALNINQDLNFNGFNAISLRSTRYQPQITPLSLVTDLGCIYVSGVDMWFNDGNGNQIQLTAGGALNAASIGGIGGDYTTSTASVFYTSASKTFTFWQNTNTPAIMDCGPILLRTTAAASKRIKLAPDNTIAADWDCTFPIAPPASTQAMTMTNAGAIGFIDYTSIFVTGPAGATDNAIARYDGSTGRLIQDSGILIDDGNTLILPNTGIMGAADLQFNGSGGMYIEPLGPSVKTMQITDGGTNIGRPAVVSAIPASEGLMIVRGSCDINGIKQDGEGFSSTKNGTGDYTITYTNAFSDKGIPKITLGATGTGVSIRIYAYSTTAFSFQIFNASVAVANNDFFFDSIGQRGA